MTPSRIVSQRAVEDGFEVTITTSRNGVHTLECSDAFGTGEWKRVTSVYGTGDAMVLKDTTAVGQPMRFYRVRTDSVGSPAAPKP